MKLDTAVLHVSLGLALHIPLVQNGVLESSLAQLTEPKCLYPVAVLRQSGAAVQLWQVWLPSFALAQPGAASGGDCTLITGLVSLF
jgi:hypothetical protein